MTEEQARDQLKDAIEAVLPYICTSGDPEHHHALLEFTLIVGWMDTDEGESRVEVITNESALKSHTLGAIDFAKLMVEHMILDRT